MQHMTALILRKTRRSIKTKKDDAIMTTQNMGWKDCVSPNASQNQPERVISDEDAKVISSE